MKTALVTDLHAKREAVEAALAQARSQGAQRFVFLGDFVGYGANPGWVVDRVRDIMGARGHSTLRRNLGSVRSEVVAQSDCTVTVVRE